MYDNRTMRRAYGVHRRSLRLVVAVAMATLAAVHGSEAGKDIPPPRTHPGASASSSTENTRETQTATELREVTTPTRVRRGDTDRHPVDITLSLRAFGVDLDLEMTRHDPLFSPEYCVLTWDSLSATHRATGAHPRGDHCHYVGRVSNAEPNVRSSLVLSTCRGLEGHIEIGNVTIRLEPFQNDDRDDARSSDRLGVSVAAVRSPARDGTVDRIAVQTRGEARFSKAPARSLLDDTDNIDKAHRAFTYASGPQTVVVRLLVVNDASRCAAFTAGASMTGAEVRALEAHTAHLIHMVAWAYASISTQVAFKIVLAGQVHLCDGYPFSLTDVELGDFDGALDDTIDRLREKGQKYLRDDELERGFVAWRDDNRVTLPPHDVAHMLTHNSFVDATGDDGFNGYAPLGTPCEGVAFNSVGDFWGDSPLTLTHWHFQVIAHELAHNLYVDHNIGALCLDADEYFIMNILPAGDKHPNFVWSPCTIEKFLRRAADGSYKCLTDHQAALGRCGNGIVDPGEACDCGSLDCSSLDPCCDGSRCQLATGASCAPTSLGASRDANAPESCCDAATCTPRAAGTECRPAVDDTCDVAEACDGISASCPADAGAALGLPCADALGDRGACWGPPFACSNRDFSCTRHGVLKRWDARGGAVGAVDGCPWFSTDTLPYDPMSASFTAAHCDGNGAKQLVCAPFTNCSRGPYAIDNAGARRGFPCGNVGPDGTYEHVCDGGTGRYTHLAEGYRDGFNYDGSLATGFGSKCVQTASLIEATKLSPSPPPPANTPPSPPPLPPPAPQSTTTLFVDVSDFGGAEAADLSDIAFRVSHSVASTLPTPYETRFREHGQSDQCHGSQCDYSAFRWTRATFSMDARMTLAIDDFDDAVFIEAVAADLGVGVDTVSVVSKTVSSRRRMFALRRSLLETSGVTVNYRLSHFAGFDVADPWRGHLTGEQRGQQAQRVVQAWNRSVTAAAFETTSAVFGVSLDVSDPPAFPFDVELEMFIVAESPDAADAINATASDSAYVATVNARLLHWWPDTNGSVTSIRTTRETYHPPTETADATIAIVAGVVSGVVFAAMAIAAVSFARRSKRVAPASESGKQPVLAAKKTRPAKG